MTYAINNLDELCYPEGVPQPICEEPELVCLYPIVLGYSILEVKSNE